MLSDDDSDGSGSETEKKPKKSKKTKVRRLAKKKGSDAEVSQNTCKMSFIYKLCIFSPPVLFALWAHICCFLSVCLSPGLDPNQRK